jgi:dihydroxyacid dehydratase/phosphogluconate dehydratase
VGTFFISSGNEWIFFAVVIFTHVFEAHFVNPLNAELNPICLLLALAGALNPICHLLALAGALNPIRHLLALAEALNPIRHLIALAGAHHFVDVSR